MYQKGGLPQLRMHAVTSNRLGRAGTRAVARARSCAVRSMPRGGSTPVSFCSTMLMIGVLKLAAVLGFAQAQGQHNGVDCAQALSDMSDDLNPTL